MEFTIEFYLSAVGRNPVQDFLEALKQSDPNDFAAVMAGLQKLRHRQNHREPLSKSMAGDYLNEACRQVEHSRAVVFLPADCCSARNSQQGAGASGT